MTLKNKLKVFLGRIHHVLTILWYKQVGPPRILTFSNELNAKILRTFGASIGNNSFLYSPLVIHDVLERRSYENLSIGDNCVMGGNNYLDISAGITMKNGSSIAPGVSIITHNGFNADPFLENSLSAACGFAEVVLEEGANVKSHSLIAMGVTIGKTAVVAACSFVNKDVPQRHLVAGTPAEVLTKIH